jgi:hypothetical protein
MADVFVSHRVADVDLARALAVDLRAAGHDVWLDEWAIGLGDSIVERMNSGLTDTSYLVLCYSADGVLAPWISREWMSALARQLSGVPVKILPLRLSGGEPPAILADIRYADFVSDWGIGLRELLTAIR